MEQVKAKFICDKKTERPDNAFEVELSAVADSEGENEQYFKYTPYGKLTMGTINPEAAKLFVPGQELYLVFIPVVGSGRID